MWGLSEGEQGAATAGLGSGQGVQGVLLRWDRGAGERQQGERREAQPPGDEEEGGGLAEGPTEKGFVCLGVRSSDDPSTRSMGGSSGFLCRNRGITNRLQSLYNTEHYSNIISSFITTEMHL